MQKFNSELNKEQTFVDFPGLFHKYLCSNDIVFFACGVLRAIGYIYNVNITTAMQYRVFKFVAIK